MPESTFKVGDIIVSKSFKEDTFAKVLSVYFSTENNRWELKCSPINTWDGYISSSVYPLSQAQCQSAFDYLDDKKKQLDEMAEALRVLL